jgi:hypothetical protein
VQPERGKLLFRLSADKQPQRLAWGIGAAAVTALWLFDAHRKHSLPWEKAPIPILYLVIFLVRGIQRVGFYEKGAYFPQDPSGAPARFIAWNAIERFYWEGDTLTVIPAASFLGGGGADVGVPHQTASVRVPPSKRVQVEGLLSAVLATRG